MMQLGLQMLGLVAPLVAATELRGNRQSTFGRMQPEVAAESFAKVESKWYDDAYSFVTCEVGCEEHFNAFDSSCKSVAQTIIWASSGDRSDVAEYLSEVCNEPAFLGKNRARCQAFASGLAAAMSADAAVNREKVGSDPHSHFDAHCADLWSQLQVEGKAQVEQEKKLAEELAAAEKKEAEERAAAEKKAAEERAAAEKKAEEERAAAEKKAAEERAAAEKKAAEERAAAEKKATEEAVAEKKAVEE